MTKAIIIAISLILFSKSVYSQSQDSIKHEFDLEKYFNPYLSEQDRKDLKNSIYDLSKMIRDNNDNPILYINRGVSYAGLGLYTYAISDYNNAIRLDSIIPEAYYNRGLAKARFSYNKQACLDIKKSIELGLNTAVETYNENCKRFE